MSRRMHRPSTRSEIIDLIDHTFRLLGGRATSQDVQDQVRAALEGEQRSYLEAKALGTLVGEYFRLRNRQGLPQAPEVNSTGMHCQLELINEDEYRYVIHGYVRRSDQNLQMAYQFAKECKAVHGVWIDPATYAHDELTGT